MVLTCFRLYDFHSLVFTQLPQHLAYILLDFPVYNLSPILGGKYNMVFTFPLRVC